nr:hypothetical protein [Tanacetum cinerariifolium]
MSTLAKNVIDAGPKNRSYMLKKGGYDTWQSRILLYIEGKEHGEMLLDFIFSRPFEFKEIIILTNVETRRPAETRMQTLNDLTRKEKIRKESDGLEGFDLNCEDLQLNATSILMTENVEAYDSDCDDTPTVSAIFMAKLSPVGSINGDEVGPSSNSDIMSKVPNYNNYHENDMFNPFIQELLASE